MNNYKDIFLLFVFFSFAFPSFSQSINISGKINDAKSLEHPYLYLYRYQDANDRLIDSIEINNKGFFDYKKENIPLPALFKIHIYSGKIIQFILNEKENSLNISGDLINWKDANINIANTNENKAFTALQNVIRQHLKSINLINSEMDFPTIDSLYKTKSESIENYLDYRTAIYNQQLKQIIINNPNTYTASILAPLEIIPQMEEYPGTAKHFDNKKAFLHYNYWGLTSFNNSSLLRAPVFKDKITDYYQNYCDFSSEAAIRSSLMQIFTRAKQNPEVYDFCLRHSLNIFLQAQREDILVYLINNYSQTEDINLSQSTQIIINELKNQLPAFNKPEILAFDVFGRDVNIMDIIANHPYTLLFIWDSEKGELEAYSRVLNQINNSADYSDVKIIGYSLDTDPDIWKNSIKKHNMDWLNISDLKGNQSGIIRLVQINTIPSVILIDKKGNILKKAFKPNNIINYLTNITKK